MKKKRKLSPTGPLPGAGDNYGMGSRAKIGKIRGDTVGYMPVSKEKMAKPPKSTV